MTVQAILDLLHGTRPFVLNMVSGRRVDVPHPDFIAITPERTSLVLARNESPTIEVIRIGQIESVEVATEAA